VLDEIGAHQHFYGLSLAWALWNTCTTRSAPNAFATHYHDLTGAFAPPAAPEKIQRRRAQWHDQIVFLRKIVECGTDKLRHPGGPLAVWRRRFSNAPKQIFDPTAKNSEAHAGGECAPAVAGSRTGIN